MSNLQSTKPTPPCVNCDRYRAWVDRKIEDEKRLLDQIERLRTENAANVRRCAEIAKASEGLQSAEWAIRREFPNCFTEGK